MCTSRPLTSSENPSSAVQPRLARTRTHHLCAPPGRVEAAQHSLRDDLGSRAVRYDGDVRPGLLVQLEIGQNPLAIPCAASDKSPQQDATANSRSTTSWVDAQLDVVELGGQWEAAMRQFPRKSWQHEWVPSSSMRIDVERAVLHGYGTKLTAGHFQCHNR